MASKDTHSGTGHPTGSDAPAGGRTAKRVAATVTAGAAVAAAAALTARATTSK